MKKEPSPFGWLSTWCWLNRAVPSSPPVVAVDASNGFPRLCAALGVFIGVLSLGGCMNPGPQDPVRVGPFFVPTNHSGDPSLGGIRRVVMLPVWADSAIPPESPEMLDPILTAALQKENRFEVVVLSRDECRRRFRAAALGSSSALPPDLLATLRREFAAEAVLFVDLTTFRPYKPLAVGLRAKLASIDGARLIWKFETVFSSDDPLVTNAARHYFLERDRSVPGADFTPAVLQSPSRFATYVAAAMFATLPPVVAPLTVKPAAQK